MMTPDGKVASREHVNVPLGVSLEDIADAIREKTGYVTAVVPEEQMVGAAVPVEEVERFRRAISAVEEEFGIKLPLYRDMN